MADRTENPALVTGRVHSVESFGSVDGPGVRYVLFLQGCLLRCLYCHNPDTWCGGDGRETTAAEVLRDIRKYKSFIAGGGVTLSGGEPLLQPEFCRAVLAGCAAMGLHTALDTAGAVPLEQCRAAVEQADLLLLDIKAMDPALCSQITGQDNRHALRMLDFCEQKKKPVWIRHVVVPGLTDPPARLKVLADYLVRFQCVRRVELLPFHQMGRYKWESLRIPYALKDTPEPGAAAMTAARAIFARRGLPVGEREP